MDGGRRSTCVCNMYGRVDVSDGRDNESRPRGVQPDLENVPWSRVHSVRAKKVCSSACARIGLLALCNVPDQSMSTLGEI
jgi:hypothetical protein